MAMKIDTAARCLAKLGNPLRLEAFRLLVRAGHHGLAVGEIQAHLRIPASTLSHHILHLVHAGLIEQQREGRSLRCRVAYAQVDALLGYLTEECCAGLDACARGEEPAWTLPP
jgi:DNA-binding transcriptional ArsR family regulator